jgi:hypothetical protein
VPLYTQACLDDPDAAALALTEASAYPLLLASLQDGCLEAAQLLLLLLLLLLLSSTRARFAGSKTSSGPETPQTDTNPPSSDACPRLLWPPMVLKRLALLATAAPNQHDAADGSSTSEGTRRAGEAARLRTTRSLPVCAALSKPWFSEQPARLAPDSLWPHLLPPAAVRCSLSRCRC